MKTNGKAVRTLRMARGLHAYELAEKAGISAGYLSNIERGRAHGAPDVRLRISAALGVPLSAIIQEPDELVALERVLVA